MLAAPLSPHHHHHAVAACLSLSLGRAAVDAVATQCGCCLEWNFIRLAWIQTAGREEGEQKGGRAEEGAAAVEEREGVWLGKIQMAANRDNERQVSRSGGAGRVQCPQTPAHTHTHRTQQTRACGNTNVAQPHPPPLLGFQLLHKFCAPMRYNLPHVLGSGHAACTLWPATGQEHAILIWR